jgi:hypothetical protein
MRRMQRFDEVRWGFPNERETTENEKVRVEVDRARATAVRA